MDSFTPVPALAGGALIGLAASLLLLLTGHTAGITGILDGVFTRSPAPWRWLFLAGLVAGGGLMRVFLPDLVAGMVVSPGVLLAAGVIVGLGTRVGGGCTSGHGIVGNSRFSVRSVVATCTFMAFGFLTVTLLRVLGG